MVTIFDVLLLSLLGGVLSLAGGLTILLWRKEKNLTLLATPFAAGALLGAAFFDLLPEARESLSPGEVFRSALIGFLIFFVLERLIHWFHHHTESLKVHSTKDFSTAALIVLGDTLHNAIDGLAIGVSALSGLPTAMTTTLAVSAHEIPQEIADFGLLLRLGFRRKWVLLANVLSALVTTAGALLIFRFADPEGFPIGSLLGIVAGFFIYIAVSDLLPRVRRESKNSIAQKILAFILALVLVFTLTRVGHGYINDSHPHEAAGHEHTTTDHQIE